MSWLPLHVHSQFSILESTASVKGLLAQAKKFGLSHLALTDRGNLHGAVEFFQKAKADGIKPIIGCELFIAPVSRHEKKRIPGERTHTSIVLLAKNQKGYLNLCKLSSLGYAEGFYYVPRIDKDLLQQHAEGLICLSSGMGGNVMALAQQEDGSALETELLWYKELFKDDFYIELCRHAMTESDCEKDGLYQESWLLQNYQDYIAQQTKGNTALLAMAAKHTIAVVATNDSYVLERGDWLAQEILLNIMSGEPLEVGEGMDRMPNPKRRVFATHETYFKSPEQMAALFADVPEAIANTRVIAEKCTLELDFKTRHYPVFTPPDLRGKEISDAERMQAAADYLRKIAQEGIAKRYTQERLDKVIQLFKPDDVHAYIQKRLDMELKIICDKGMADYLLIVWDFINWAKVSGIPMGPGRGSGAGSIVLYLIGITDIEPLRFSLFFERFINPERPSYPDIDVDICMDRRQEVIDYTVRTYGKDCVAQIITMGTMKAKMAIRDVGRVLGIPLAKVNALAKLVPEDLNITIEKALDTDHDLLQMVQTDSDAKRIIDAAIKLEGCIRSTGIHAAGIIVSGSPLVDIIPLTVAKDSDMAVTQYSMKPVEAVGMLKIDFLGLKTLTSIQKAAEAVKASRQISIDWVNLPLDDAPTFAMLNRGKTMGVFQLESGGMQDLARQLHLDKFEEIIAVVSLYRPGPMEMIPTFINRKHGREAIQYDHPWLEGILSETYGIMVYQEQVMQIAGKLANYSLGEGDILRRAMGKKDHVEMQNQRKKFVAGCAQNQIPEETAVLIFDQMEKFASYGFNKSHAAAYGYLAYVTAYMKANYCGEWMAALMTCDSDDLTKVAKFIREAENMGIAILPPDVNEAGLEFCYTPAGIRFAMGGIKGVGTAVVEAILQERSKGKFTDLYDFVSRLDPKRCGRKQVELLVEAGSFDFTGWSRDQLFASIPNMMDAAAKAHKDKAVGAMSLFSLLGEEDNSHFKTPPKVEKQQSSLQKLLREKELLGFFLTAHPMDSYKSMMQKLSCVPLGDLEEMDHDTIVRCAIMVESVQVRISQKSQRKFAICLVGDGLFTYELPIWSDLFDQHSALLRDNQLLYTVLQVEKKPDEPMRLSCRWMGDLTALTPQLLAACDQAYDKAKSQARLFARSPKSDKSDKPAAAPAAKPQAKPQANSLSAKVNTMVELALNLEKVRHSHILKIKALMQEQRGQTPVKLAFAFQGQVLGTLSFDEGEGVADATAFKQAISALSIL